MKRIIYVTATLLSSLTFANLFDCTLMRAEAINKHGQTVGIKATKLAKFEVDTTVPAKLNTIPDGKKITYYSGCFTKKAGPCVGRKDILSCVLLRMKKQKPFDAEKYFSDWANEDACRGTMRPVPSATTDLDSSQLHFSDVHNLRVMDSLHCKAKGAQ